MELCWRRWHTHSSNLVKTLEYRALRERSGTRSCRAFWTLSSIFTFVVKVVKKQWKEFSVEGGVEDAIIKFIF